MINNHEPTITVNGVELSQAQAMTVRVALFSYAMELADGLLGDDEHGASLAKGYTTAIRQITALMRVEI